MIVTSSVLLLLVVRPGAPSSFLLLLVRHLLLVANIAPSSKARSPSKRTLFLVAESRTTNAAHSFESCSSEGRGKDGGGRSESDEPAGHHIPHM